MKNLLLFILSIFCFHFAKAQSVKHYGNGGDGNVTVTGTQYTDNTRAHVTGISSSSSYGCTISIANSTGTFVVNDPVIVISLKNVDNNYSWAFVKSVSGSSLEISSDIHTGYPGAFFDGTTTDPDLIQIIKVKEWENLTINSGGVVACHEYDLTDKHGGILVFKVKNTLTINAGGVINASAKIPGGLGGDGGDYNPGGGTYGSGFTTIQAKDLNGNDANLSGGDGILIPNGLAGNDAEWHCNTTHLYSESGKGGDGSTFPGYAGGAGTAPFQLYPNLPHRFLPANGGKGGNGGQGNGSGGDGGGGSKGAVGYASSDGTDGNNVTSGGGGNGGNGGNGGGFILVKSAQIQFSGSFSGLKVFVTTADNGGNGAGGDGAGGDGGDGGQGANGTLDCSDLVSKGVSGGYGFGGNGADGGHGGNGGNGGDILIVTQSAGLHLPSGKTLSDLCNTAGGQGATGGGTTNSAAGTNGTEGGMGTLVDNRVGCCTSGSGGGSAENWGTYGDGSVFYNWQEEEIDICDCIKTFYYMTFADSYDPGNDKIFKYYYPALDYNIPSQLPDEVSDGIFYDKTTYNSSLKQVKSTIHVVVRDHDSAFQSGIRRKINYYCNMDDPYNDMETIFDKIGDRIQYSTSNFSYDWAKSKFYATSTNVGYFDNYSYQFIGNPKIGLPILNANKCYGDLHWTYGALPSWTPNDGRPGSDGEDGYDGDVLPMEEDDEDEDDPYSGSVPASINSNNESNIIHLFPNPANNQITLTYPIHFTRANIQIFDATGKMIFSQELNNENEVHITTSSFANGIYTLKILTNDQVILKDFVISK